MIYSLSRRGELSAQPLVPDLVIPTERSQRYFFRAGRPELVGSVAANPA